jgi:hypothetical protein
MPIEIYQGDDYGFITKCLICIKQKIIIKHCIFGASVFITVVGCLNMHNIHFIMRQQIADAITSLKAVLNKI